MRFEITRTSGASHENPFPNVPQHPVRRAKTSYVQPWTGEDAEPPDNWFRIGRDHYVDSDGIHERTIDHTYWEIDIASLEELLSLAKIANSPLVITPPSDPSDLMPTIEIYDDYRE